MNVLNNSTVPYTGFTGQFIAGRWVDGRSGKSAPDINPYNDSVLTEIVLGDATDLDRAYTVAAEAQRDWAKTLPAERAAIFRKAEAIIEARREELTLWLIRESGSTRMKADGEVTAVLEGMREASQMAYHVTGSIMPVDRPGKEARTYRQPRGVIGVISPWNVPFHLSNRSVAPAIATGNAVVLKPASDTPVSGGLLLAKIYEEAGLPPGVLNVVIGSGKDIGDAFCAHPIPRLISFTGSTEVGLRIAQTTAGSKRLKRLGLELGGNAPLLVLDDADIGRAVECGLIGRFLHQGQICMSTNRIIVDNAIHDRFIEAFSEAVRNIRYGDPEDSTVMVGPLCNDAQVRNVRSLIETGLTSGCKSVVTGPIEGRVVAPHVFADVENRSPLAQTEIFGPVAPIIRARGDEDAIAMANDTDYGLSSAIVTKDVARGLDIALRLEAGMTHINDMTVHDYPHVMFGGEKNSGLGRFNGHWIIDEFTTEHLVTVQR